MVKFIKKSDTTKAFLSSIANYIAPQDLSVKCIRMGIGGKSEREL